MSRLTSQAKGSGVVLRIASGQIEEALHHLLICVLLVFNKFRVHNIASAPKVAVSILPTVVERLLGHLLIASLAIGDLLAHLVPAMVHFA